MPNGGNKARAGLLQYGRKSFSSLAVRNYRLYFIGQTISLSGTWLQAVAQTWLVLQLTHSGTQLGLLAAAQFLPVLLFGAYGGVIADRFDKRNILYVTQTTFMVLAFILALLVGTGLVQLWMVYAIAVCFGFVQMVDSPTRQSFIIEMVGSDRLTNAISLNSIIVNLTRIVGPLLAAALIAGVGLSWCFFINSLTFTVVLFCLWRMDSAELHSHPRSAPRKGQLMEGFRYIWHSPVLRDVLIMMAIIGTLAYEFVVVLPVLATKTFHGDASSYALMTATMSLGSLLGGLVAANRGNPSPRRLVGAALAFGISMLLAAVAPTHGLVLAALFIVGFCSITFNALGNSTLQLNSSPEMRGRVMSLWTVAFLGSTPIGGPIIGWISDHGSPRLGLATGGIAAIVAAFFGVAAARSYAKKQALLAVE